MKIIRQKKDLINLINKINSLSFVPTMGGLHKGHELLIKKAKKKNKFTIVSIFVNPKQFDSKKDFNTYPRNLKKDLKILRKLNIKCLYLPSFNDVFSFKTKHKIYLHPFSKKLCGKRISLAKKSLINAMFIRLLMCSIIQFLINSIVNCPARSINCEIRIINTKFTSL